MNYLGNIFIATAETNTELYKILYVSVPNVITINGNVDQLFVELLSYNLNFFKTKTHNTGYQSGESVVRIISKMVSD